MKKNKIVLFALITLLIVSAFSIGLNIKASKQQDKIKRYMINVSFNEMVNISRNLDSLIVDLSNNTPISEETRNSLTTISKNFIRLDTVLKQYATFFPPKGTSRSSYTSIPDFGTISDTLITGTSVVNDSSYDALLTDDQVSENEARYLNVLKEDIDLIITAMASTDNPLQANQRITVYQMDNILSPFFSKWSYHNEDSPYFLLRTK